MNLKSKEILSKKLDFIFDYMTQQELSVSLNINQWNLLEKIKDGGEKGADFFMLLANADIPRIAIENPIGCMSTKFRRPDQIIRPFQFGHPYNKDVCLWLKGLPKLVPTNIIPGPYKHLDFWSTKRHKGGRDVKAITFQGIAEAMAAQWGDLK